MCGIVGIYSFKGNSENIGEELNKAVSSLDKRGPDEQKIFMHQRVALGHTRLAIIDTTQAASQPFTDETGRFTIIFNGEIYNFQSIRDELKRKGYTFKSTSDTEVLLKIYIEEKEKCLPKLNGFFAFAIFDKQEETLFIARDRMGIKPLLIYQDEEQLIFASEMKAITSFSIPKEIDYNSLHFYFELNYIPGPATIFRNIRKLRPGNYLIIKNNKLKEEAFYKIPYPKQNISGLSYKSAQNKLYELLDASVRLRMIADVPLGSFLSGGIDSSVIVSIASKYTNHLNTFSIGYANEPFFDETHYAELVAQKFKTNHTTFKLTNDDLFDDLYQVLDYIDEPFADSSALPVHILSKHTRKHVTVALSGDGADELFSGYNKHLAHFLAINPGMKEKMILSLKHIIKHLPQSRNNKYSNISRQANKYIDGYNLSAKDRYWKWASIADHNYTKKLLLQPKNESTYQERKRFTLNLIEDEKSINDILFADMHLVLQNDMLMKVDLMSMANSLEVRTPFLDHNIVNFVFSLPEHYKIDKSIKKKILQDTFKTILPTELYKRPKHGFEVPLLKWFKNELNKDLNSIVFDRKFVDSQGIFNWDALQLLEKQLFSYNPADAAAKVWAIFVFQHWWKKISL